MMLLAKLKHNFIILAGICLLGVGCSSIDDLSRYSGEDARLAGPISEGNSRLSGAQHEQFPWELLWQGGQTVQGNELRNLQLLEGDRLLAKGDRRGALDAYQRARSQGLTPTEMESGVLRIASMQLSLRQPDAALRVMSDHFRASGSAVDDVTPEFSLLFGYAYSDHHDVDQSLAWLSRASSTSKARGRFAFAAQEEVAEILKTVPLKRLNDIETLWDSDSFIRSSVRSEKTRRERGGEMVSGSTGHAVAALNPSQLDGIRIGALLPLTGRFGGLGRNVQNGIELAVAGQGGDTQIKFAAQNTGDNQTDAMAAAQQILSSLGPSVVLGPLISEQANAVRGVVEGARVPSISFSKRSDFAPGGSTFRLGVTTDSQVDSLIEAAHDRLGIIRVALISTPDLAVQETAELFRRKSRSLGMQIAYEGSCERTDTNGALAIATDLEKLDLHGIFFADNAAGAANVYSALSEEFRARVKPMGIGNWDNQNQLMSVRTLLNGAVFVSPFFSQSRRPVVAGFVAAFKERYHETPDFLAAQGFDAATLAIQAIRIGQRESKSFTDALRSIDAYDGMTGRIYVGADGELRRSFAVLELKGDALTEINAPEGGSTSPIITAPTTVTAPPPPDVGVPMPEAGGHAGHVSSAH